LIGVIAGFDLLLSFAWMVALGSIWSPERRWTEKTKALRDLLGLPKELAPWGDTIPLGLLNRRMLSMVDIAFYALCASVLIAAGGIAGLWKFP